VASLLTSSPALSQRNRFRFWLTHVRWFQRTQVCWPQGALQLSPNVAIETLQEIFRLMATFRPTECLIAPLLLLPRAVLRGEMSARDLGPLPDASWGDPGLVSTVRPRPQHGTGAFCRSSRGAPGAWRGCGEMRRGQRRADRFRRICISRAVTKQPHRSVVGRLPDMFDKGSGGVSGLQHSSAASRVITSKMRRPGDRGLSGCPVRVLSRA